MLRPNFEDPMDTAQDLVENNITLFTWPTGQVWKQWLEQSPNLYYNELGENYR